MKKIFATLVLFLGAFGVLSSLFVMAPAAWAITDYGSFEVDEILNVDDTTSDNEDSGSTTFFDTIEDEADAKGTSRAGAVILRLINILTLLVGTFAFVTIMYGGFMLVTANGEESKIERGKGILIQAILGLFLAFLAYFIVAFVQSFFY